MPGQAGTSVIFGRSAAYGGPFVRLHELHVGTKIRVTNQEGVSTFKAIDRRKGGDLGPPPLERGKGRLLLMTSTGTSFMPSGVLRVDADLVSPTLDTGRRVLRAKALPHSEQALGTDVSTVWALAFWLEALVLLAIGTVWSWLRWGHHQTWIVFVPMTVLVAFYASDQFIRLLPNLM
jgi:hypothetical protein